MTSGPFDGEHKVTVRGQDRPSVLRLDKAVVFRDAGNGRGHEPLIRFEWRQAGFGIVRVQQRDAVRLVRGVVFHGDLLVGVHRDRCCQRCPSDQTPSLCQSTPTHADRALVNRPGRPDATSRQCGLPVDPSPPRSAVRRARLPVVIVLVIGVLGLFGR